MQNVAELLKTFKKFFTRFSFLEKMFSFLGTKIVIMEMFPFSGTKIVIVPAVTPFAMLDN